MSASSASPEAVRILGVPLSVLREHWLRTGRLQPSPYRRGRERLLLLADVERSSN